MINNNSDLKKISILDIFKDDVYIVPIYQRNYAWGKKQIEQLIDDIDNNIVIDNNGNVTYSNYFLGTLITNQKEYNLYEVIDGQQRLTTLFLISIYLSKKKSYIFNEQTLKFEAREKYTKTLENLRNDSMNEFDDDELHIGYKIIEEYFKNNPKILNEKKFIEKLKNVFLIRIQVPKNIDLNHYFEVMNTRGEQLEQHQIVKANILSVLTNDIDKNIAAKIWDSCSDMSSYIQMNFNSKIREILFSKEWSSLNENIKGFENLYQIFDESHQSLNTVNLKTILEIIKFSNIQSDGNKEQEYDFTPSLKPEDFNKILEKLKASDKQSILNEEQENDIERFESIISFSSFILQVNAIINEIDSNDDSSLSDKKFLETLKKNWESEENAKKFIFKMLQCRTLFDKYVLKREYAKNYKESGKWSLQKIKKYEDKKHEDKPIYKSTYGATEYDSDDNTTKRLRTLEVALRITYTSPKTMHWITLTLQELLKKGESADIIKLLEDYCRKQINENFLSNKNYTMGTNTPHIVFNYLDYLLYRDKENNGYKDVIPDNWEFKFRNSIEHFHAQKQNMIATDNNNWEDYKLDDFGNLALISISGNSKFSNEPPSAKIEKDDIIKESLKLCIMKKITEENNKVWEYKQVQEHRNKMLQILCEDCKKLCENCKLTDPEKSSCEYFSKMVNNLNELIVQN